MYVRTISRKNKDGSKVEYVQLAHNYRDPDSGFARAEVIHSFGRKDQLDLAALRRLVKSLCRFLSPEDALEAEALASRNGHQLSFEGSKSLGGVFVLRALWEKLQIDGCIEKALLSRKISTPVETALFAMVANRALAPDSKLAVEEWAREDVALDGAEAIQVHLSHIHM